MMPNQMPACMGYQTQGFNIAPLPPPAPANFPVHVSTRNASNLDTSLLNSPFHPPTPASSIPSVAKTVPYIGQGSAPRQEEARPNMSNVFNADPKGGYLQKGALASPYRPPAPSIAYMSPMLGDVPIGPDTTKQNHQTSIQDVEDAEDYEDYEEVSSVDDDIESAEDFEDYEDYEEEVSSVDDAIESAAEVMSECSSDTSKTLTHEWDDDVMNNNSGDGVINLQHDADHNDSHEAVVYGVGVDVDNSLHINNRTGNFHLGLQWQAPGPNRARSNAGPEFGRASIWNEDNWGHGSVEWGKVEGEVSSYGGLAGERSDSHGQNQMSMRIRLEPVYPSAQEALAGGMRTMHLTIPNLAHELSHGEHRGIRIPSPQSYQGRLEHQAPAPAHNCLNSATHSSETATDDHNDRVIRRDPIPVDLSMSGGCQSGQVYTNYWIVNHD